ncbi:MAG: hypothetical protein DLM64_16250 [Solirubrobacterales bacterium]|nr:MAG: hypothetical protein DLM64_16250 [Solirubrobacterales bacterium]
MGADIDGVLAFLGVGPDRRLLGEDLGSLPATEQHHEPAPRSSQHDRLVGAGSLLTGTTLIGGAAMLLYGGGELLFGSGSAFDAVLGGAGVVLTGTHWGWVHVAEYIGLSIDERRQRVVDDRWEEWLAAIQPYPRFSVGTRVLEDASTRIERVLHRPVLTAQHTFTFARAIDGQQTFDAHASAQEIAAAVETMRRQARLETDRMRGLWEAAFTAYQAALLSADEDRRELAARRAAATALSEHINASLLEPPLVE